MYLVKVIKNFNDLTIENPKKRARKVGDTFTIEDDNRLRVLMGDNEKKTAFVEFVKSTKKCDTNPDSKKIVIYQSALYYIGGIETFVFNLVKRYRDYDITIRTGRIDVEQIISLSQYCNIELDKFQLIDCDILMLSNYDGADILHRVKAKKIYQMIHADYRGLKKLPMWEHFQWHKHGRVDQIISVSEETAKGLKETMGYDSEVIYNLLDHNYREEEGKVFITLSRATMEKGIGRIVEMAKRFKEAKKKFVWFLCCSLEQLDNPKLLKEIKSIPEFVIIPPSRYNKMLIKGCDYLVQLSDTESFCYSAYEALQRNVPVILTDFPEAYNIVDDGENDFILDMDLKNLDVEKIFNFNPEGVYYIDRCDYSKWEEIFTEM